MPNSNLQGDFPEVLTDAIWLERTNRTLRGEPFTKADCLKLVRERYAFEKDRLRTEMGGEQAKAPRPRNLLVDTLATLNGAKLEEVSPTMFRQSAIALADIKRACPWVTVEEIQKRAANYRVMFPRISTVSPTALAKWWGDCGDNAQVPAKPAKATKYDAI